MSVARWQRLASPVGLKLPPTIDSITDNVLVVSGLDDLNRLRENLLVSNSEIFLGANVAGVSTYTSNSTRPSASRADPFVFSRDAKILEEPLSKLGDEPIPPSNISGR